MVKLDDLLRERRLTSTLTRPILLDTDASIRVARAQKAYDDAVRQQERAAKRVAAAGEEDGNRLVRPNVAAAQEALAKADADLADASAELEAAMQAAEPHFFDFVFESVGSERWQELVELNPSPASQRERLGDNDPGWDLRRFETVAVAFCLKDPVIPQEELDAYLAAPDDGAERPLPPSAVQLRKTVPDVVWEQIFAAALVVNRGPNRIPKSWSGSAKTPASEPRSEQP